MLTTESQEVLRIWAANFKELLYGEGAASCLELPSSVRREVEVEEIGREEVETAMHKIKEGKATGAGEVRLKKVCFYIAQYPVRWTAQSALHFLPTLFALLGRPVHSDTNSASPGSILVMQQLRATNKSSLTLTPLSTAESTEAS